MRLWNLSSFEKLETPVLSVQSASVAPRRAAARSWSSESPARIAIQLVALAAVTYTVTVCGTGKTITIPQTASRMACNVDPDRAPLEALFESRFSADWTRVQEDELLTEAVKKSPSSVDGDLLNLIHTGQQESLAGDVPRLAEKDILKLTRGKRA